MEESEYIKKIKKYMQKINTDHNKNDIYIYKIKFYVVLLILCSEKTNNGEFYGGNNKISLSQDYEIIDAYINKINVDDITKLYNNLNNYGYYTQKNEINNIINILNQHKNKLDGELSNISIRKAAEKFEKEKKEKPEQILKKIDASSRKYEDQFKKVKEIELKKKQTSFCNIL